MGVPAFFRWLIRKYPSVISHCVEDKVKEVDGIKIPVDSSQPNPNGLEFDNLYIDMNGIIHPCTHPEDKPAPKDEDEMMIAIFDCIDRLFSVVRPRKLLFMAIDGVAPRAKMNQQRSRRFRASKESFEKIEEISRLRSQLESRGVTLPPEKPKEACFDSNCITPGTPFMTRLSICLDYYIHDRLNNDPGWQGIKVILSDANVPGEGEHKIMDFIRKQRAQPDHDPNTQHVLCGADADLIMLGLATHEPNFTIIREEFRQNKAKPCDICQQLGHEMKDCPGCPSPTTIDPFDELVRSFEGEIPLIFVRLNVLREYLEQELMILDLPFKYDFERALDDWVFMCFFVGNDFLPHLPSLEIREGAIDRLVTLYKDCVLKTGGFITDSGNVNLSRVQIILNELGKVEDEIFKKRHQSEALFKQRDEARKRMALQNKYDKPAWIPHGQYAPIPIGSQPSPILQPRQAAFQGRISNFHSNAGIEALIRPENQETERRGKKRSFEREHEEEKEVYDEVRLWEEGFKDRYYESKFDVPKENLNFRINVAHEYIRGLCWVLRYYYQGCASWTWFFPYHYAPFASDFVDISNLPTDFEKGTQPFRPLEQLMGVFPAASSSHVPKPWATLMHDPYSPIIDFYPVDFKIDLNGKKFAWQGVALLPFVDEKRLFKALKPLYEKLTPEEKKRNIRGDDKIYLGSRNNGYKYLKDLYGSSKVITDEEFDFCSDGMRGKILLSRDNIDSSDTLVSPIRNLPAVRENVVVCARFRHLTYSSDFIFQAKRLKGAVEPPRVLKPEMMLPKASKNWYPRVGMVPLSQRASLSNTGHRFLNYYSRTALNYNQNTRRNLHQERGGTYSHALPAPPFFDRQFSQGQSRNPPSYGYTSADSNNQQSSWSNNERCTNQNTGRDPRLYNNYYRNQEQDRKRREYNDNDNDTRRNSGGKGNRGGGGGYYSYRR